LERRFLQDFMRLNVDVAVGDHWPKSRGDSSFYG
jgi:hypothetical protein